MSDIYVGQIRWWDCMRTHITLIKKSRESRARNVMFAAVEFLSVAKMNRASIYVHVRYFPSYRRIILYPAGSFTMQGRCTSVMIGTISVTAPFPPSSRCGEKFSRPSFCGNCEIFTIAQIYQAWLLSPYPALPLCVLIVYLLLNAEHLHRSSCTSNVRHW